MLVVSSLHGEGVRFDIVSLHVGIHGRSLRAPANFRSDSCVRREEGLLVCMAREHGEGVRFNIISCHAPSIFRSAVARAQEQHQTLHEKRRGTISLHGEGVRFYIVSSL